MNNDFFAALSLLGAENSVETDLLVEKVKSAMTKAIHRAYPDSGDNVRVDIDPVTKTFDLCIIKTVVDDEPLDDNEINIDQARLIDPSAVVGGTVECKLDTASLSRNAAQSAKQSIRGDLREISRENLLTKFQDKENECITATVSQVEPGRGTVTLIYDKTELYLFRNEQIPGEVLKEGQSVKVYITGIANKQKKPIIKISRAHRDLVKRLFELEVPEIYDGTVEVMAISREAGARTKIAVQSHDPNVDAVGACIGPKRSRITAVVNELNGEKIDIINWSDNPAILIENALSPAKVISVMADPDEKTASVIVPDYQLSLAIGKEGQNARLAARLTGYKIDIKNETQAIESGELPENYMELSEGVYEEEYDDDAEEFDVENTADAEYDDDDAEITFDEVEDTEE